MLETIFKRGWRSEQTVSRFVARIVACVLFQGAFVGIQLEVWDDDIGHRFGVGHADDLVDIIQFNLASIPADKDLQSATARKITVRSED